MRFFGAVVAAMLALLPGAAGATHLERDVCPAAPSREFPPRFDPPRDEQAQICRTSVSQWPDKRVGGWGGGDCPADHAPRTPVVFVHGNTTDAWFWRGTESGDGTILNVAERFLEAGWCARELWAISYTGDASPRGSAGSGYATYNDINADELSRFIRAVREFLGVPQVDVVAHSLGVTVVRKAAFLHRNAPAANLLRIVRRAVMIAGANHGTTSCRGAGTLHASHVCEEVEPGSAWLAELNSGDESPGPTEWMSVCDCSGAADQFFLGPDAESPVLKGSREVRLAGTAHNTLARGRVALDRYLPFLLEGTSAEAGDPPKTAVLGERHRRALPRTGVTSTTGAGAAALGCALALGVALRRRRCAR
jgi:triacylglycerol lipase